MDEMIKQGAIEGFEDGMQKSDSRATARSIEDNMETITVSEECMNFDSVIDVLKKGIKAEEIICAVLCVIIVVVIAARLLVF